MRLNVLNEHNDKFRANYYWRHIGIYFVFFVSLSDTFFSSSGWFAERFRYTFTRAYIVREMQDIKYYRNKVLRFRAQIS